jgi:hypothetical protein
MKKTTLRIVFVATFLALALGLSHPALYADHHEGGAVPVVDTHELMELLFEHGIEDLKAAVAEEPTGRKGWSTIYKSANSMAEVTNLLYIRSDEDYTSSEDWKNLTTASREAGVEVAAAAAKQDFALVTTKYNAFVKSCNACHEKFVDDPPIIEP